MTKRKTYPRWIETKRARRKAKRLGHKRNKQQTNRHVRYCRR